MTAQGKRIDNGLISVIKMPCHNCYHHKAWSKTEGIFCCRCGSKLDSEIIVTSKKPKRLSDEEMDKIINAQSDL